MGVFVLGSINLDAVARVDDLPRPGETVAGISLELFPAARAPTRPSPRPAWARPPA
jgi:ribokinase